MAGNKLSPRQKMINMMYLVLTALLALNVSAEILQAFESLRSSMHSSATSQGDQNTTLANLIVADINKKANPKYFYVRDIVAEIQKQTHGIINHLDDLSLELERIGDKDPLTGEVKKMDETEANYQFWLGSDDMASGGRGNGKAKLLREKLVAYHQWANALYARHDPLKAKEPRFTPLVLEPSVDPAVTKAESKQKTWEYLTFHGKPVIADLAMLEKMKLDVREVETGLLNLAKGLSTTTIYSIDSLIAFEAPSAQAVAAGTQFTTVIGVGVASKNIKPEFVGSGIKINPGGSTATLTMTANGNVIPKGQYEGVQSYQAMIKVPMSNGEIQEIPLRGQFKVRKPEVLVRSKELQLLYKDCGNKLEVDVPALGDSYNPDFSQCKGGKVIRNPASPKDITIVPQQKTFELAVSSKSNGQTVTLDKLTYNVVMPPRPSIEVSQGSNILTPSTPVNRKMKVRIKVKADPEFASTLSRDARYRAEKIKVWYKPGIMPAQSVLEVPAAHIQQGIELDLNVASLKSANPGDKIYFEIVGLKRINFEDKTVEIPGMSVYDLNIPATLK